MKAGVVRLGSQGDKHAL